MKFTLRLLLLSCITLISFGFYHKNNLTVNGKLYIGIGVSLFAFILMPLFIYLRYNNRISDFIDKRMETEEE